MRMRKLALHALVVALGALSRIEPFAQIPPSLWTEAILALSPVEMMKRGNVASFLRGREAVATEVR